MASEMLSAKARAAKAELETALLAEDLAGSEKEKLENALSVVMAFCIEMNIDIEG